MATITFEQIRERVARHQTTEAVRNAPRAVAVRAVYTLASALADLSTDERREVLALLADETNMVERRPFGAALAAREA